MHAPGDSKSARAVIAWRRLKFQLFMTRRAFLAHSAAGAGVRAGQGAAALAWSHLPAPARAIAPDLGLTREGWAEWQAAQRAKVEQRIAEGTAEHVAYYLLQSRSFCAEPSLEPAQLAKESPEKLPEAVERRASAYETVTARDERHRLLRRINTWPLERCYRHTMAFLRAKELERRPLEELYYRRGLSSDSAPWSGKALEAVTGNPARILIAGPGLDFTRRENFRDDLPLVSHQLHAVRERFPQAWIETVDVRLEVVETLGARRLDITTEVPPGAFDLVIATNLLLYFENREMLTAMAGLEQALAPGGRLVHNDQRFAAKVFGEALGLTMERFEPLQFAARKGIEQWDRVVIHRKP